jgi:hypothetical protein
MQLRKSETFRRVDHHYRCVRHVDANFDQACGDKHLRAPGAKVGHRWFFFPRRHAAMNHSDAKVRQLAVG